MTVEMKSGLLTTEFWIALATSSVPVLNHYLEWNLSIDKVTQTIMFIAPLTAYILSRTMIKRKVAEVNKDNPITSVKV